MPAPIRVVIADDHELVREGTRRLLASHDDIDVVAVAADGTTGMEEIRRSRPDVALVDISMPGMSGIEVTRQTTVELPSIAVLVLTVHEPIAID